MGEGFAYLFFGSFDDAVAADVWVGITAVLLPSAVRRALRSGLAVHVAVVTHLGPLGDAVAALLLDPGAVRLATRPGAAVVLAEIALLAGFEDAIAARRVAVLGAVILELALARTLAPDLAVVLPPVVALLACIFVSVSAVSA